VPFVRANAALTISDVEITRMTNLLCFLVPPYDPLLWIGELQAEQLCEPASSVMIQNGSLQHETSQMVRNALLHQSRPYEIAVVYIEWAGASYQKVVVPWTRVEQSFDALAFASHLGRSLLSRRATHLFQGLLTSALGNLSFGFEPRPRHLPSANL
jgi:hypothetical protein